jgi:hypothetical protein
VYKILSYKTSANRLGSNKRTWKDFIQAFEIHSELLFSHCSYYSDTRGVTALPPNRNNKQSHTSSLWQDEVWMAGTKEVLTFPSCFFFRVVAPLYLKELDCFTPHDMILLIRDLYWCSGYDKSTSSSVTFSVVTHGRCHEL